MRGGGGDAGGPSSRACVPTQACCVLRAAWGEHELRGASAWWSARRTCAPGAASIGYGSASKYALPGNSHGASSVRARAGIETGGWAPLRKCRSPASSTAATTPSADAISPMISCSSRSTRRGSVTSVE
eukprot:scaffold5422_cov63-Phaeocystis_antarctica.AAC.3